jgi:hypothetical protein
MSPRCCNSRRRRQRLHEARHRQLGPEIVAGAIVVVPSRSIAGGRRAGDVRECRPRRPTASAVRSPGLGEPTPAASILRRSRRVHHAFAATKPATDISMRTLLSVALASFAGTAAAQQQALLPFNHHLAEAPAVTLGTTSVFRTTAGRFQVLYDAPNFAAAGVTGPITITRLRFRGEDTEQNHGGQLYSNVTVQLASTSLSAASATWSTTWATNFAPAAPNTTTAGAVGTIPTLTVAPSLGTAPNNFFIDIDLAAAGASFTFDPTSAEPNLLVEIIMPTAPTFTIGTALALIQTQDTTGSAAQLFASCRTSGTVGGTTGVTINPPVMGIEFTGAGGFGTLVPARVESYGAACGGAPSTFYQAFQHLQRFDLANSTLTLTPDNVAAPNVYTVSAGGGAYDPTKVNATPSSTLDDALFTHALGFTFNYPGGSTTSVLAGTNGFVWLDSTMTDTDFTPTVAEWLGNTTAAPRTARLAAYWADLNAGRNTVSHPNSGLHVLTDTSGGPGNAIAYVTWFNVGRANTLAANGGHAVIEMQMALFEATGVVEFRYGNWPAVEGSGASGVSITGFTRGQIAGVNSVDPQSRDLSVELPFTTAVEGTTSNIGLVPVQATQVPPSVPGRMFPGASITWNAVNVPAGALLGAQLVDLAANAPGLQVPGITAPGCMLSTSTGALIHEVFVLPTATATGTVPFVLPTGYNPALLGIDVFAQWILLGGLAGGPNLITGASNSWKHTVGLQ